MLNTTFLYGKAQEKLDLPDEIIQDIIADYNEGYSVIDISARYHLSRKNIKYLLRELEKMNIIKTRDQTCHIKICPICERTFDTEMFLYNRRTCSDYCRHVLTRYVKTTHNKKDDMIYKGFKEIIELTLNKYKYPNTILVYVIMEAIRHYTSVRQSTPEQRYWVKYIMFELGYDYNVLSFKRVTTKSRTKEIERIKLQDYLQKKAEAGEYTYPLSDE